MNIKSLVALFSTGIVFTFTSCGSTQCNSVKLEDDISLHSVITMDEKEYEADFKRAEGAGWKATFTKPETVKGLEVDLFNDTCTLNFKGLTYTSKRKDIPEFNMVSLITSTLDDCISGKVKCEKNGDKVTENGSVNGQDFSVELKDNKLKSIIISDMLKAEIS